MIRIITSGRGIRGCTTSPVKGKEERGIIININVRNLVSITIFIKDS